MIPDDYRFETTFNMDFNIAESCYRTINKKMDAIKDTFKRGLDTATMNPRYYAEFIIILNWRCWGHYDKGNKELSSLYSDLYYKALDETENYFPKKEDQSYIFNFID